MRAQAALLKREIEAKLADRIPAALSPVAQQAPRLHPIGNAQLDTLLGGGLPLGSVCELTGPDGSGRSSISLSLLAVASTEGACAYIDVSATLSPHSAAAAGIDLANLLWIRFAIATQSRTASPLALAESKPSEVDPISHRPIQRWMAVRIRAARPKGWRQRSNRCSFSRKNGAGGRWRYTGPS